MSAQLISVPFHSDQLFLTDHNNEPYTPIKSIVENMDLDWKVQHRKLMARPKRWGMVMMTIATNGGGQQMVCLPIRKLAAFLYSIDPRKVKPAIKSKIEQYQEECDEVLWNYWNTGHAINSRHVDLNESLQTENTRLQAENQQLQRQCHSLQDKYTDVLEYKVAQLEQKTQPKPKRSSKGPVTEEEQKVIINMHLSGYSRSEIAKTTGRSTSAVYSVIREYKAGASA